MRNTVSETARVERIPELRALLAAERAAGRRIGFVPTMGALHEGHLSLIRDCRQHCDATVVSIFVNPLQFGPSEDFSRYPRDLDGDIGKCAAAGASVVFAPSTEEMYPAGSHTRVRPGPAAQRWEGAVRPGHFEGVLTVVAKLFNIVDPDISVFGQKDWQQATLIRLMVQDLCFRTAVRVAPTVRDRDGLALSSRNAYLNEGERRVAGALPLALATLLHAWRAGERDAAALIAVSGDVLRQGGVNTIDYLTIVSPMDLEPVNRVRRGDVGLLAARVGSTRLIDNVVLDDGWNAGLEVAFP